MFARHDGTVENRRSSSPIALRDYYFYAKPACIHLNMWSVEGAQVAHGSLIREVNYEEIRRRAEATRRSIGQIINELIKKMD